MIRISRKLALICLLLVLPAPASASVVFSIHTDPGNPEKEPDIKAVLDKLKKMDDGIGAAFLKMQGDIMALRTELLKATDRADELDKEVKALRREMNFLKKGSLEGTLDEIRARLTEIDKSLGENKREAKSVPLTEKGRILLANHYQDTMIFYINDKRWEVPAQSTYLVENVPVGPFTYKVSHAIFGDRSSDRATLSAGQTYTLTVK
jgi:hypothetical protein